MSKFIVVVIDSLGVGAMDDVPQVRPQDIGANTCGHILEHFPNLQLPILEKLGLINSLGYAPGVMQPSVVAVYGTAALQHEGGDTYMGHQEILGTRPQPPLRMPFSRVIDNIEQALLTEGWKVERWGDNLQILWVANSVAIGDNLEADLGQVFNVSANLAEISFEKVQAIGKIVRCCVQVGRVIVFGGILESSQKILESFEEKQGIYAGISSPRAGFYRHGFQVAHLGYGVDSNVQVPKKLYDAGVETILIGKVADIVNNDYGISYRHLVDTKKIMDITRQQLVKQGNAFICTNIQETDLAGHAEDVSLYADRLQLVDTNLGHLMSLMQHGDCLIVMADHGNDPTIGHSRHTREKVPLLAWMPGVQPACLGDRETLSDVGATVCDFFKAKAPENGTSFLSLIKGAQDD